MAKRKIIDPHQHFWQIEENGNYPWLQKRPLGPSVAGDIAKIAHDYCIEDYLADTRDYDVVKTVHVEAVPGDGLVETRWVQSVANEHGIPQGIVVRAELDRPDIDRILAEHSTYPNVRGVRHIVNWHRNPNVTYISRSDLLTDANWLRGFRLLKRHDLSFDLQLYPSQMADAGRLARSHPDTSIILNHAGMPVDRDAESLQTWRDGMRALAAAENVTVKISGLGMVDWSWTTESIRPFVLEAIEIFGVDRSMFASNFPVDKIYSSFSVLYGAFETIVGGFSEGEKSKLFHDNAKRVYRL